MGLENSNSISKCYCRIYDTYRKFVIFFLKGTPQDLYVYGSNFGREDQLRLVWVHDTGLHDAHIVYVSYNKLPLKRLNFNFVIYVI